MPKKNSKRQKMMQIYKFGGASITNAEAVRKIHNILLNKKKLIVVVSAIGKTTNALEKLHQTFIKNDTQKEILFNEIKNFHFSIYKDLFNSEPENDIIGELFQKLYKIICDNKSGNDDFDYDKIVSFGELFSSEIVFKYLSDNNLNISFLDVRKVLVTDEMYKEAGVIWKDSAQRIKHFINENKSDIIITQGFIGATQSGDSTTLGREGSDFTAAALGYMLDAKDVTIWKDVPGIMNADPARCKFAEKIEILSYQEAIELAFYGAKIIHPKTIKPLENKSIPLYVKSFIRPEENGSIIKKIDHKLSFDPIYIIKEDQTLVSISPKDFSFIVEENISKIFDLVVKHRIKVNMTQNSAISYSASLDSNAGNLQKLIEDLQEEFTVKYNNDLVLITIRHYNADAIERMIQGKKIYVEQRSRITARFVVSQK